MSLIFADGWVARKEWVRLGCDGNHFHPHWEYHHSKVEIVVVRIAQNREETKVDTQYRLACKIGNSSRRDKVKKNDSMIPAKVPEIRMKKEDVVKDQKMRVGLKLTRQEHLTLSSRINWKPLPLSVT